MHGLETSPQPAFSASPVNQSYNPNMTWTNKRTTDCAASYGKIVNNFMSTTFST